MKGEFDNTYYIIFLKRKQINVMQNKTKTHSHFF